MPSCNFESNFGVIWKSFSGIDNEKEESDYEDVHDGNYVYGYGDEDGGGGGGDDGDGDGDRCIEKK